MLNRLVAYYPLDEGSGDALDYSGNSNDGTVNGATQGATGVLGSSAYSFDGSDDAVVTGNSGVSSSNQSFTASAFINTNDLANGAAVAEWDASTSANQAYYVQFSGGRNQIELGVREGDGSTFVDAGFPVSEMSTNTWYHVAGVGDVNEGEIKFYFQGELAETAVWDGTFSGSANLAIGASSNSVVNFNGEIDDVRVYDRVLSPQEISYLYNTAIRAKSTSEKKTS